MKTRSKLLPRKARYDRIVAWAWARYMPYDQCFIGLGECCRYTRILDMAGARYLGLNEVYRRPILACPTLRWKKKPAARGPVKTLAECAGRRWAYFTATGHLEVAVAATRREAIIGIESIIGHRAVREEIFPL